MCLICMKYRIIIIIIISLGKISLSYIANTSRMHACTHARTRTHAHTREHAHPHPRRPSLFAVSVRPISPSWLGAPLSTLVRQSWPAGDPLKLTTCGRLCINDRFGFFSRIKQILGRTETRTRDRICFQTIRSI